MRVEMQKINPDYIPARVEYGKTPVSVDNTTADSVKGAIRNPANKSDLTQAVEDLNVTMSMHRLKFEIHEDSGRCQVQVIDQHSEEVIRELPPDTILDISARIKEMLDKEVGVLFDTQA